MYTTRLKFHLSASRKTSINLLDCDSMSDYRLPLRPHRQYMTLKERPSTTLAAFFGCTTMKLQCQWPNAVSTGVFSYFGDRCEYRLQSGASLQIKVYRPRVFEWLDRESTNNSSYSARIHSWRSVISIASGTHVQPQTCLTSRYGDDFTYSCLTSGRRAGATACEVTRSIS